MNIIDVIISLYGMTKKEAIEYNKKITNNRRILLIKEFENQAKLSFYND